MNNLDKVSHDKNSRSAVTLTVLNAMKQQGEKIAMLTAYDAGFTRLLEQAQVDAILVGDSLGNVVQGHETTLPVSMEDMIYHCSMVARARKKCFLIADMPFMSYGSPQQALENAGQLMKQGFAHMVKLEGGAIQLDTVSLLSDHAIPVCGHLGLTPQSIHQLGGYRVQGRDAGSAETILNDALALESAGAQMLVLECVPENLAAKISTALTIPVIGIGAGIDCDGQVLVLNDMLGMSDTYPRFVKNFMLGAESIQNAISSYVNAVKDKQFPQQEHTYE